MVQCQRSRWSVIDHIDDHCRVWIELSPFVVISSVSAAGAMDVSPKGDPAGFVRVLDPKTLAVPDRPGNHRDDTFLNVLENPSVGLMFVVPNRREVVRVSGTAVVVKDGSLLESMAVGGKVSSLALVVRVHEAMFHCGKSMIRSHMWEPELWGPVDGLPTYGRALAITLNLTAPSERWSRPLPGTRCIACTTNDTAVSDEKSVTFGRRRRTASSPPIGSVRLRTAY